MFAQIFVNTNFVLGGSATLNPTFREGLHPPHGRRFRSLLDLIPLANWLSGITGQRFESVSSKFQRKIMFFSDFIKTRICIPDDSKKRKKNTKFFFVDKCSRNYFFHLLRIFWYADLSFNEIGKKIDSSLVPRGLKGGTHLGAHLTHEI